MTDPSTAVLGEGFDAERGGSLYIDGSTCTNPNVACVIALSGGKAWAHGMTISSPLRPQSSYGLLATETGMIEAQNSVMTGMYSGINAANGGAIECDSCTITGSYGDGVSSDGGIVWGVGVSSQGSQTGSGFHAFHQGVMHLFNVVSNATGNKLGGFSVEPAGTESGIPYAASSISAN